MMNFGAFCTTAIYIKAIVVLVTEVATVAWSGVVPVYKQ